MPLETHQRAHGPAKIADFLGAAEFRQVDHETGGDHVRADLLQQFHRAFRRAAGRAEPVYEHLGISINPVTHEVTADGQPVLLSAREWSVLELLLARPGMVLSRKQLEEKLYSWRDDLSSNAVEVYIHGLRKKLGPHIIQNVRGVGYLIPKAAA